MAPLVTVTTPCFRADRTLPRALASLVAQTVDDFECIVVDDGSPTPAQQIVDRFGDDRFRVHSFETNRGRPVARQKALEMARGRFVCMLDADDWYYPDKLEHQLEILEARPELAAVATSVAVVDNDNELTGVRAGSPRDLKIRTADPARPPRLSFPTTMLRRDVATDADFDPRLRRAEDPDYLMKALGGHTYGISGRICYAYRETYSTDALREALLAFRCQRITFRDQLDDAPIGAAGRYLTSLAKSGLYRAALATGTGRWLFERRNRAPTPAEQGRFDRQRRRVDALLARIDDPPSDFS